MSDLRYKRLAYVALRVSDLERSTTFMKDIIGLDDGAPAPAGQRYFRSSNDHHNVVLIQADAPGLERVAFEMESEQQLSLAHAHLAALGLAPVEVTEAECKALGQKRSIRFVERNSGLTIELIAGMETLAKPYEPTLTKIARMGHIVVGTNKPDETIDFFTRQMNFKVSDIIDGAVTFMRCFPNPLHHSFAIARAPENRLHHVNFMVTDFDDVGIALHRMQRNDVPIVYGPGRHPPSGSVFLYFLDPDGMTFEFSYGMEEFEETGSREPRTLPLRGESFDSWGAAPPDKRFASVGKITA
jgi:2,3-dihydroxy-p-cumate/2,3-dihydroxybenzoate 3,4-dioxygenase